MAVEIGLPEIGLGVAIVAGVLAVVYSITVAVSQRRRPRPPQGSGSWNLDGEMASV